MCPLGGEFGVFDFFAAFVADFGEPVLEGFGFGGWDGLDEAENLLGNLFFFEEGEGGHGGDVRLWLGEVSGGGF